MGMEGKEKRRERSCVRQDSLVGRREMMVPRRASGRWLMRSSWSSPSPVRARFPAAAAAVAMDGDLTAPA